MISSLCRKSSYRFGAFLGGTPLSRAPEHANADTMLYYDIIVTREFDTREFDTREFDTSHNSNCLKLLIIGLKLCRQLNHNLDTK